MSSAAYEAFLTKLRYHIPNFNEIDSNPEFLKWCDRKGINLESIAERMDAEEAIRVYRAFTQERGQQQGYWTRQKIKEAYDKQMRGEYSDDEFKQIEQDIFKALRENRVK